MIAEYWQEFCIVCFFVIAMINHGSHSRKEGIRLGSEQTLDILEKERIIKINEKGEINGVQSK
ncbi:MAG TPA: hypothetical protein DCW83_08685 [Saprospirales bacterium]|jgi:hypothetical protein|nr:hypothetical protein [Saprospirales bacterium]